MADARVFVAEDDADMRDALEEILEEAGNVVLLAPDLGRLGVAGEG